MLTKNQRKKIKKIKKIISETEALLEVVENGEVSNLSSLYENIITLDLEAALNGVKALLQNDNFKEAFAIHCKERADDNLENTINFHTAYETSINEFYWKIARVTHGKGALQVLIPSLQRLVKITIPETIPKQLLIESERADYLLDPDPTLSYHPIPTIHYEDLKHYIISETELLDTRDIANFHLKTHQTLRNLLSSDHPKLTALLYSHNVDLIFLESDILTMNNKGLSPKKAITKLIRALRIGGELMSGQEYASPIAQRGYLYFFSYYDALPSVLRGSIEILVVYERPLKDILEDLRNGECVQTGAYDLHEFLSKNKNNYLLENAPILKSNEIKELEKKYKNVHLDTKKEIGERVHLPKKLVRQALQSAHLKSIDNAIDFLNNFPPEYYHYLFDAYEDLFASDSQFENLKFAVGDGFFSHHELDALIDCIGQYYGNWDRLQIALSTKSMDRIIKSLEYIDKSDILRALEKNQAAFIDILHSPIALRKCLSFFNEEEIVHYLSKKSEQGDTVMHITKHYPDSLTVILNPISEKSRLILLQLKGKFERTVFCMNSSFLAYKIALQALSSEDRLLMSKQGGQNVSPFWRIRDYTKEEREEILSLYKNNQLIELLQEKNTLGIPCIHEFCQWSNVLDSLIAKLTADEFCKVVITKDDKGNTALHAYCYDQNKTIQMINAIPRKNRLKAILVRNNAGLTILDKEKSDYPTIARILKTLSPTERFQAAQHKSINNTCLLDSIVMDKEIRETIRSKFKVRYEPLVLFCHVQDVLDDFCSNYVFSALSFFFSDSETLRANRLRASLHVCTNKEEMLQVLFDFLKENGSKPTALQMKLIHTLSKFDNDDSYTYSDKLAKLEARWNQANVKNSLNRP